MHILGKMEEALSVSRKDVSDNAPKMTTLKINKDKIRDLIGPGGKVIRELCERFQAKIEIEETGIVSVAAASQEKLKGVIAAIEGIAKDPEVGDIYDAVVVKLMDFGAFVRFMGEREGLVHISEVTGERIERVSDYLKVGDKVSVKFLGTDDRGKSKLSMKGLNTLHKKEHH
jgi:polyribonucleotide nucleotidyltransferase